MKWLFVFLLYLFCFNISFVDIFFNDTGFYEGIDCIQTNQSSFIIIYRFNNKIERFKITKKIKLNNKEYDYEIHLRGLEWYSEDINCLIYQYKIRDNLLIFKQIGNEQIYIYYRK